MADTSHSAGARVGKAAHHTFNKNTLETTVPIQHGLVTDTRVSPDFQIGVLSRIDETGSATIGDLAGLFAGYTRPVAAIVAMAEAGVVAIEPVPVIDANTTVIRRQPPDAVDAPTASPPGGRDPSGSDGAMSGLPASVETLLSRSCAPAITVVAGEDRRDVQHAVHLQRPGCYLAIWDDGAVCHIYSGSSNHVANRIASGPHLVDPRPADRIVMITGGEAAFDLTAARILERMFAEAVESLRGTRLTNIELPQGAPVDPESYNRLRLVVAEVLVAMKTAGFAFAECSYRELMAGPRIQYTERAPIRVDGPPEGELHRLEACGVVAEAVRTEDDDWILLRGSQVRNTVVASATASISHRRAALLHSGVLTDAGDHLLLQRDIRLGSGSMCSQFVTGAKSPGLAGWKSVVTEPVAPQPAI